MSDSRLDPLVVLLTNAMIKKSLTKELDKFYSDERFVGAEGKPGVDGKDGEVGKQGPSGKDGRDGLKGEKGNRGERGPRGPEGPAGKDGRDGKPGRDGISKAGSQGPQGPAGKDGKGIERLFIALDGGVVVEYSDGTSKNIGKAQVNNVTNVSGGGSGIPLDHYVIHNVSVEGSKLIIACNNNKRFEVDLPSGGGGGSTNLSYDAPTRTVRSDTGTDAPLPLMSNTLAGLVPPSGGGTSTFLRADGVFASPPGGSGVDSFETVSKNLTASDATISYSGGDISTIAYSNGITKTFAYGVDGLSTITLSGSTPGGIDLVKTFNYTLGEFTGFTYS